MVQPFIFSYVSKALLYCMEGCLCGWSRTLFVKVVCLFVTKNTTATWYPLQHKQYSLYSMSASFITNSTSPGELAFQLLMTARADWVKIAISCDLAIAFRRSYQIFQGLLSGNDLGSIIRSEFSIRFMYLLTVF